MEGAVVEDGADDADPLSHIVNKPSANPHRNVGILMLFLSIVVSMMLMYLYCIAFTCLIVCWLVLATVVSRVSVVVARSTNFSNFQIGLEVLDPPTKRKTEA